MADPLENARQDLAVLRGRFARGEIDEATYQRQRELMLAELSPEERSALGTSTPEPTGVSARSGTPRSFGPSGASGSGVRTHVPSLSDLDLAAGTILLDQWKLERELGRGGFGAVFAAEELHLHEKQAVKVLDPAMVVKEELLARFRREVSLMRKLVHPRIVRVFDYREDPQQLVALISMELVSGGSVKQLMAEAKQRKLEMPLPLALEILTQTLEALAEAHSQGVIHRDVTPGNVLLAGGTPDELLAESNRNPKVKLVDFGIAGLVERSELSQKSRVLGTAAYVAPEVLDPNAEITPAADVYGAGAMGYELLTGKLPLGRFEEPRGLRGEIDEEVNDFVLTLLASRPELRPGAKAGAWGLRTLREEAAKEAERRESDRSAAAERALREARAAESARRREAEEETKRRQEAERRAAEEKDRQRAEEAQASARTSARAGDQDQGPGSEQMAMSPRAWGLVAVGFVLAITIALWALSSQRTTLVKREDDALVQVDQQTHEATAEERLRAEAAAEKERQREAQILKEDRQEAARVEQQRVTREREQARAAEAARLDQERRAAEATAERQREAEAAAQRQRDAEAAAQRQREVEAAAQLQKEAEARERSVPAGAWRDDRTDLLWTSRDNGRNISWDKANSYCEDMVLGEFSDWRLPTLRELEYLYDGRRSQLQRGAVTLTQWWVWSGDLNSNDSSVARAFCFFDGGQDWRHRSGFLGNRCLCVRRSGG